MRKAKKNIHAEDSPQPVPLRKKKDSIMLKKKLFLIIRLFAVEIRHPFFIRLVYLLCASIFENYECTYD